ncbi:MAG: hypothetical protein JW929_11460 [Anaerolineales bacterium]|nr:hypothetical protein [Anaerolineales bacterium]
MDIGLESARVLAGDFFPGALAFWVKAEENSPEMRLRAGDRIVCIRTKARPGDLVLVDGNGKAGFRPFGDSARDYRGVVFAVVRDLEPGSLASQLAGGVNPSEESDPQPGIRATAPRLTASDPDCR